MDSPPPPPLPQISFGVCLWELLTRSCPFPGLSQIQVAVHVINEGGSPSVPAWCRGGCEEVAAVAEACMRAEEWRRPSFEQVVSMLEQLQRQ